MSSNSPRSPSGSAIESLASGHLNGGFGRRFFFAVKPSSKPGLGCLEIARRASRLIPRFRLLSGMVGFDGRLMKNFSISAAILFTATLGVCAASAQAQGDKPTVVRLDPALPALVSPDAKLHLVKVRFVFTKGTTSLEQARSLPL